MTTYEPSFTYSCLEPMVPDWMAGARPEDLEPWPAVEPTRRDPALIDYTQFLLPESVCPVCLEPLDSPFCRCNWAAIAAQALAEVSTRDSGGININTRGIA